MKKHVQHGTPQINSCCLTSEEPGKSNSIEPRQGLLVRQINNMACIALQHFLALSKTLYAKKFHKQIFML